MYKMIDKDEILRVVREKGPIIPNHMKKDVGGDTIIIGAILSQLVAEGKVKITHTKIGGSPAYYTVGSEEKLQEMIRYLNEKDRRTAEFLREKKVLRESTQDPLVRVSLRSIKDFSRPLEVTVKGQKEMFWKWYLLSPQEAEDIIAKEVKPEKKQVTIVEEPILEKKKEEKLPEKPETKPEQAIEKKEVKEQKKAERQEASPEVEKPKQKERREPKEVEKPSEPEREEIQKPLMKPEVAQEKDAFFGQIRDYLSKSGITILDYTIVRKSEIDLYISVPTRLGNQEYFCKAKNKKKVSDGDLSSAYVQGQQTKLPIIFLTPGELTKKAKEMLAKSFKGMIVKSI
jgi:hypothetical protein